jgi:hypothetical protein
LSASGVAPATAITVCGSNDCPACKVAVAMPPATVTRWAVTAPKPVSKNASMAPIREPGVPDTTGAPRMPECTYLTGKTAIQNL